MNDLLFYCGIGVGRKGNKIVPLNGFPLFAVLFNIPTKYIIFYIYIRKVCTANTQTVYNTYIFL